MALDAAYVNAVVRYRPVILFMYNFVETLRANPRKDTPYDEVMLRRRLNEAGVPR